MELFEHQWATYRRVVDHDLMEHRALSGATAAAIETWLAARPKDAAGPHLVDLGCGDLALLAPLLRRLTLGSFLGVDLSAGVLPRAEASLGAVSYPCRWRQEDLCWPGRRRMQPTRSPGPLPSTSFTPPSPFTISMTTKRPASCTAAVVDCPRGDASSGQTCSGSLESLAKTM